MKKKNKLIQILSIFFVFVFLFSLVGCGDRELLSEREVKRVIRDVYGRQAKVVDIEYKNEKFDSGDDSTLKNVEIYTVEKDGFQWKMENTWTPIYFDASVIGYEQTLIDKYWDSVATELSPEIKNLPVPPNVNLNIKEDEDDFFAYELQFLITDFSQKKEIKEYLDEVLEWLKEYDIKTKKTEFEGYKLVNPSPYVFIRFEEQDYYNSFSLLDGLETDDYMEFYEEKDT